MQNLSGQTIKGYELMERIGAGAFGAVYRSYQSTVGREVALKVILPGFASHPNFIRRFEMEAQIVARLEHLHIVPLYDYWRDPSGAYLAMRWLRGGDLSETIRERPLSLEETTRVFDQIGAALSAAHRSNIIHRDLKPSNILLDQDGNTYLADFGIATEMGMPAGSAVDGENIVGSPAYLSPEQARRELVTPRSDIYSLGVILYETLSGEHPFPKTSPVELIYAHLNEPLPKVNNLPPDLQEGVNEVIQKATAKNPQNRYQDVLDMVNALRQTSKLESEETGEKIVESLTAREQEILSLIVEGHTNKRIAQELYVEVSTIKWYITQIYRKLNVRSRAQAIMRSRELQLIFTAEGSPEGETDSKMVSLDSELLRNPYKGLRNFEGADSRDFYGREAMIDKLVDRLDENGRFSRFLAIVGPSGSGKSSLLKAGLIPALRQGAITGSERWFVVEMAPGNRPLDELEIALSRVAAEQAGNIRVQLERGVNGLARVAGLILPNDGSDLLIAIDQFEEVFTLVEEEATRVHFLNLIHAAVNAPHSRVRVAINLRADFYDRPLHYPKFGEMVRKRLETVLPLSAEELERAILHPARGVGVDFQPGLVASIIDEINYQPGALPLLQYALTELFESRKDHTLTHQAYHDIGGTVGALANRAEEIYRELDGEGKNLTQQLFLRLVSLEDSSKERKRTSNIRQRIFRSDLLSIVSDEELMDEIIDTFAAYRLLSLDHDTATRSPTVELAHEALIQQWDRLQIWIEDSRDDLRQHQRLRTLMREWIESDREKGFLLRETRLDAFETWSASTDISLTPDERDFIEASLSARRARRDEEENRQQRELETARKLAETERRRAEEQTQAAQRLQRRAVFLSAALMVALISAVAALAFARNATVQHRNAFARELAGAALNTLEQDPDLSTLLVLEAAEQTRQINGTVLPEVEEALHLVLQGFRLLLTLPHGGSAAFSPDGSRLATGGGDGTIKIWDTETGQVMFAFKGHDEPVPGLAFSPDGNRLASISLDGYMRIWDTKGVQMLGVRGDLGDLMDMDFSPDGKRIAAGGWIGARVWNAENGEALAYYSTLNSPIGGIKFSPDGNTLATSHQNGITILWDAETDKELSSLPRRRDPHLSGIDISPSGRYVAASSNEGVTIWDYEGNVIETLFHPAPVVDIAYHPKGTLLATSSEDGTIRLWEVTTSQQLLQLGGHKDRIRNIKFHPDGKRLVSTSVDGVTRIWDISPEGSREWFAIDIGDFAFNASFDSTGTRLAVSSRRAASIVIDLTTGHTIFEQGITSSNFYQIALSPDRKHLALVNLDGTLSIWDLQSGVELFRLTEHRRSVSGMAFSSDGMRLATADTSGTVILWDAEKWEKLLTLEGHTDWVPAVAFSPDGERLATASLDTRAMVWDVNTGEKLFDLDDHTSEVWDVAFGPDGGLLATASWDSTVKIWNAESGELVKSLESHTANVNGVAFSPDGKTLASAGYDQTVKLWDVTTWDESLNLSGNQAPVTSVNFSPDGKKLVTGNADGMVRVYALDIDDLIMLARNRVTRPLTEEECQRHLHTESCPPAP